MGGCLIVLIALALPRLLMFFMWLLTDWFSRVFETALWPILGLIFAPYTTLAYMAAILNHGSLEGGWIVLLVVAALVDAGLVGGGGSRARGACKHCGK